MERGGRRPVGWSHSTPPHRALPQLLPLNMKGTPCTTPCMCNRWSGLCCFTHLLTRRILLPGPQGLQQVGGAVPQ